jgi:hypothetical protein
MLSVCLETAMIAEYAGTTNKAGLSMGVFFSFCFISFYGGGIDVVGYVYCCECISFLTRRRSVVTPEWCHANRPLARPGQRKASVHVLPDLLRASVLFWHRRVAQPE